MYGNHAFLLPFSQSHTQYRHALARTGGDTKFSFAYVTIGGKSGPAESDRKLKETIKYLACQTQTGPLDHSSIEISSIILYSMGKKSSFHYSPNPNLKYYTSVHNLQSFSITDRNDSSNHVACWEEVCYYFFWLHLADNTISTQIKARQGKFIYIAHFIHNGNSKCFA